MIKESNNLFINTADFEVESKELGRGPYGTVHIIENAQDFKKYAAKIFNTNNNFDGNDQMVFLHESILFHKLKHPSISSFSGINFKSFKDPQLLEPTIITRYFPNGSLQDYLSKNNDTLKHKLTSTQKYINLLGISDSLRYLHDSGIVHMNLKPENILFDENYYPHVSDYYISKCFPKFFKETLKLTIKGQNSSSIYYPPEIFLGGFTCDQSIDVFSFGLIAYEIITEKVPEKTVNDSHRPIFPDYVPESMSNLLNRCWSDRPIERPQFKEIFEILSTDKTCFFDDIDEREIREFITILEKNSKNSKDNIENSVVNEILGELKNTEEVDESTRLFILGLVYYNGYRVDKDVQKAILYYRQASKLNNKYALNSLGEMYFNGIDIDKDYIKAKKYFEKAADLGNSNSLINLGILYHHGNGVDQDYSKSIKYFERASELGNSMALNYLGYVYYYGEGTKKDYIKAKECFEKAIELGCSDALNNMGNMYYDGNGVDLNKQKAVEYYEKAAKLGNSSALNTLGNLYYSGNLVEKDVSVAVKYYKKAAKLGNPCALCSLGILHYNGDEVIQNYSKAKEYLIKADDLGNDNAKKYMDDLFNNKTTNLYDDLLLLISILVLIFIFFAFSIFF